jgi:hypothetical protein
MQAAGERNYHIFYNLLTLASATDGSADGTGKYQLAAAERCHATCNAQCAACNTQRATHNVQHADRPFVLAVGRYSHVPYVRGTLCAYYSQCVGGWKVLVLEPFRLGGRAVHRRQTRHARRRMRCAAL